MRIMWVKCLMLAEQCEGHCVNLEQHLVRYWEKIQISSISCADGHKTRGQLALKSYMWV